MNERMDERIQTLAEQAKQYAREQMAHPMDPNLFSAAVFQSKFAELIVEECCKSFQGYTFEEIAVKTLKATFRS